MGDHTRRALGGFVLLLPAGTLVLTGLLGLEPPATIVHPFVVMVSLAGAVLLNLATAVSAKARAENGSLLGAVAIQVEGRLLNLTVVALGLLLAGAIAAYLFVENFARR
jgi:hypothetical protein